MPVDPDTADAVSQTTGELRLGWDPFIRHQHLVEARIAAFAKACHDAGIVSAALGDAIA